MPAECLHKGVYEAQLAQIKKDVKMLLSSDKLIVTSK